MAKITKKTTQEEVSNKDVSKEVSKEEQLFRDKKFFLTNASVSELRTGVFAPYLKVSGNSSVFKDFKKNGFKREIEAPWGKAVVKNRILTQIHRDIMDALFIKNVKMKQVIDDQGDYFFYIFFKRGDILKYMEKKQENSVWLNKMIDDIKSASISIENNEFISTFNIINEVIYSKEHEAFRIELSKSYCKYFIQDLTINYKNEFQKLVSVNDGLIKAIIRYFWTQNKMQINIFKLLKHLGYADGSRNAQTALNTIYEYKDYLEQCGILLDYKNKNLMYSKSNFDNGITFISNGLGNISNYTPSPSLELYEDELINELKRLFIGKNTQHDNQLFSFYDVKSDNDTILMYAKNENDSIIMKIPRNTPMIIDRINELVIE